jgi:chemotaxis receptor (MCP) glutamine deamidase CheD
VDEMRYFCLALLILINAMSLTGCIAAATTAAGVGGSAAITHTINGITYRTFTSPQAKVRTATIRALGRMQIQLVSDNMQDKSNIRLVTAKTTERKIEIQLEPISPNTTRMRVVAKKGTGIFYDASTAEEIIQQTKISLG